MAHQQQPWPSANTTWNTSLFRPILKPKSRLARFHNAPKPITEMTASASPSASPVLRFSTPVPNNTPVTDESASRPRDETEVVGRTKTGILDLPIEILQQIALELPFAADVLFLSFTCRQLYTTFGTEHNYFWFRRRYRFLGYPIRPLVSGRSPAWHFSGAPQMIEGTRDGDPYDYDQKRCYKGEIQDYMKSRRSGACEAVCNLCGYKYSYYVTSLDALGKQHCPSCFRVLQLAEVKHQAHRLHPLLDVSSNGGALHPYLSYHGRACKLLKATTQSTFLNPPSLQGGLNWTFFAACNTTPTSEASPKRLSTTASLPSLLQQPPTQGPHSTVTPTTAANTSSESPSEKPQATISSLVPVVRKPSPIDYAANPCDLFWHATLKIEIMLELNQKAAKKWESAPAANRTGTQEGQKRKATDYGDWRDYKRNR
ncbi:hypothetical protein BJ508DRAFT_381051 [Ascobolus immersus RN42]|uniref:F-box domain-containing protein n=1 Tax=Ascobolus immersus RN42 TaxID=1160509 RepID=A0A3N4HJM0_ASCIM|nr:hypothetical protein BJ508DRAFT_381051 [Ascobolus immersus RN42]